MSKVPAFRALLVSLRLARTDLLRARLLFCPARMRGDLLGQKRIVETLGSLKIDKLRKSCNQDKIH
jgi:hypothetical protein